MQPCIQPKGNLHKANHMKSRKTLWLLMLILCTTLYGCGSKTLKGLPPGWIREEFPEQYALPISKLEAEGQRNWVLNLNELAVDALRRNDRELAILSLDEAILEIEVIYGNSEQARQARSVWRSEGRKIFKGDPYERSMTYFYRGVLYMQDQEWDNARACFRSALFQDAFAEDQNYNADWCTFEYLIGVCELQMRNATNAREAFDRALKNYDQFRSSLTEFSYAPSSSFNTGNPISFQQTLPLADSKTNLLVITQQGRAPVKKAIGQFNELLTYDPGGGGSQPLALSFGDNSLKPVITDSLYYQAKTRGGRALDSVLRGQAQFKEVGEKLGTTSAQVGTVILMSGANNRNDEGAVIVGAGLVALGAISYGISSLIRPQADIRAWKSLPETLGIWAGELQQSKILLQAKAQGAPEVLAQEISLPAPGNGLQVILVFSPPMGTILPNKHSNVLTTGFN